jgi:hypothetical protein
MQPAFKLIVRDNLYGRVLFRIRDLVAANAALAAAQQQVALAPETNRAGRILRRSLWNVITGDAPYRAVFWQLCDPQLLLTLARRVALVHLGRLKSNVQRAIMRS